MNDTDVEVELELERLVEEFGRCCDGFADFDFLDAGGTLQIRAGVPAVSALRIELPGTEFLQLASVIIDADGLEDPIRQTTRTASSALNRKWAKILQQGRLLDPANTRLGVHTRCTDRPWLEIAFDRPVDLHRVLVRNRDDHQTNTRVRGLQVLARTSDGWWTTLYDGIARERQFVRTVERHFAGTVPGRRLAAAAPAALQRLTGRAAARPRPVEADLVRIMTSIMLRDYSNLFRDLDRTGLSAAEVSRFRTLVTETLLRHHQLEWNIHGVRRTFRFWSEAEKTNYLSFALGVVDSLRTLTPNTCLGFGSVLSVVRDHDLIPHDDDLDVLIAFEPEQAPTLAAGLALVEDHLRSAGYQVQGSYTSFRWVLQPRGGGRRLDAFVGLFEGDRVAWYPGRRGSLTRDMMFPPSRHRLFGLDCPVPRQPEQYLEQVYGPGWATPDPHFRHTWKRSEYADILS